MSSQAKFHDPGSTVYAFMDEILVVCPTCGDRARIVSLDDAGALATRRLVCSRCGYTNDWAKRVISFEWHVEPRDSYFGLPLWLQAPCAGDTLWAYNRRHLDFLEAFVGAKHRERKRNENYGWQNSSLASRLPQWIQSAKNRAAILKAIRKLREKL